MAIKSRTVAVAETTEEADTAEETVPTVASTNWDTVSIIATTLFLVTAIILVLREAGVHYGAGPFAK